MPQENWNDINEEFGEKLGDFYQEKWKSSGFSVQQTKEWIEAGLEVFDYDRVSFWKNKGFSPHEAKEWIKVGLKPL